MTQDSAGVLEDAASWRRPNILTRIDDDLLYLPVGLAQRRRRDVLTFRRQGDPRQGQEITTAAFTITKYTRR